MFYSSEEFKAQMAEYLDMGMSYSQAYAQVKRNEDSDKAEYDRWLDEQDRMDVYEY